MGAEVGWLVGDRVTGAEVGWFVGTRVLGAGVGCNVGPAVGPGVGLKVEAASDGPGVFPALVSEVVAAVGLEVDSGLSCVGPGVD